jgi:hypothetical protein
LYILEDVIKNQDIESFKHQQLNYSASLPLYVNSNELPEPPTPPEWLIEENND